ncbi:hypothetical protein BKA70DRAFT_1423002 [Coprinopsis sp. MPI-PUGE-AT-0042]|nr:hypothetical protein BKA70DRAFT_1423002 [Coprinopsis sp. MPI-PUGE-AT-0042]
MLNKVIQTFALMATLATAQSCTYSFLQNLTTTYVSSQRAGQHSPFSAATIYTENFRTATLATGILSHPLNINHTPQPARHHAGDWLFNATGTQYYASRENWFVIPEADRNTRETIKAGGDAYLDLFSKPNTVVPWGTPCARLEGGIYTGRGLPTDSCNVGVPSGVELVNRRYVIDEMVGAVDIFLNFGGANGIPDSHEFRLEKGKLRFVHTMTVMG